MRYYGVLFQRNSGKIVKTLEDKHGCALLKMFGLNNTSSSRDYIVLDDNGIIVAYFEGKKNDMPTICKNMEGKNVSEICEGLLEALHADSDEA